MKNKKYKDFYLETSREQLEKLSNLLLDWENNPRKKVLMEEILMLLHSLKGSSATMSYKKTNILFHTLEDVVDAVYREDLKMNQNIIDSVFDILKELKRNLSSIKKGKELTFVKEIRLLKNILKNKEISLIGINRRDINKKSSKFLSTWRNPSNVSIPVSKLNKLQDLLDDLLLSKSKIEVFNKNKEGSKTISACIGADKIINDLRREISRLSVLPIKSILSPLPYLARTIAQEEGKKIVLNIDDNKLKIDKSILDQLNSIIIQFLRNSIVHGIQKTGVINLKIELKNNNIRIEFEDDGKGIDWQDLLEKAIKNKVINRAKAKKMTIKEIRELIFTPGISSLESINEEGGRGMGLSLVKNKVEELKGEIEVISKRNKGTKFIIELPLPLSIFRSIIFRLGEYVFGIQLTDIKKIINLKDVKDFSKTKVYSYGGKRYKVIHIKDKVNLNIEVLAKHIVLLNNGICIPVQGNIKENEMVIKKLSDIFNIKYIKGVAVNSMGQVVLILDINKL